MSCKHCLHFEACLSFWHSDYSWRTMDEDRLVYGERTGCRLFVSNEEGKPTNNVQKGFWQEENRLRRSAKFLCSVCGGLAYYPQPTRDEAWQKCCPYKYCPNCGAKMGGVDDEQK